MARMVKNQKMHFVFGVHFLIFSSIVNRQKRNFFKKIKKVFLKKERKKAKKIEKVKKFKVKNKEKGVEKYGFCIV